MLTIKTNKLSGELSNGTPYTGFTVNLLDGEQDTVIVAPQGNLLFQITVVGSPKSADEENAASLIDGLAADLSQ